MSSKLITTEELYQKTKFNPNEGQDRLVRAKGSTICGLAAAGTGKSTTANIKLLNLECVEGVNPEEIVAIVYTSEGKKDLQKKHQEACQLLGIESRVNIKTFHAFFLGIIRHFEPHLDIMRPDEQSAVLFSCMKDNIKSSRDDIFETYTGLLTFITNNMLRTKREIVSTPEFITSNIDYYELKASVDQYRRYKKSKGLIDYDDMQTKLLQMLETQPEVLEYIHSKYKWFIIDEYQDISKLQVEIVKYLVKDISKLTVIGDDDQCIYRWRGSESKYILNMPIYFPGTEVITIDVNYRCPENILMPFVKSVECNKNRLAKNITAFNKGGKVEMSAQPSNLACSRFIVDDILRRLENTEELSNLNEYAILYRNNKQPVHVVDMLIREGIPVNVSNDKDILFNNFIVKDIVGLVKLACSPEDKELFNDFYKKIVQGARDYAPRIARAMNGSKAWYDFMPHNNMFAENAYKVLTEVEEALERDARFTEIVDILMGLYRDYIYRLAALKHCTPDDYFDVIKYLKNVAEKGNLNFGGFQMYLDTERSEVRKNSQVKNAIKVMTMHSCKGLEFKHVYILDDSDEHCPNQRRIDDMVSMRFNNEYIEEYIAQERHLHYVAGTRAKETLMITYNAACPSRFLIETGLLGDNYETDFDEVNRLRRIGATTNYADPLPSSVETTLSEEKDIIDQFAEALAN